MVEVRLNPPLAAGAPRREGLSRRALPYARHVTDQVIALDTGALMVCFQLEGASFETADVADLNDWHLKLNAVWRNLAADDLAVWHHVIRREESAPPAGRFTSAFAADLDRRYRQRLASERMFVNELYLTLVLHPRSGALDRENAAPWTPMSRGAPGDETALKRLQDAARDLQQHLARYAPRALTTFTRDGVWFSAAMGLLQLVLTGRREPTPLVRGHLGDALYDARLIFGREAVEIREAGRTRYAGILGVKEYPAQTRPGQWNGLLSAPLGFVASQSFTFLSKAAARTVLERKQNQMVSARDRAASQIEGLGEALDELISNRFAMGEHQASLLLHGDDLAELAQNLSVARAALADAGLVSVREDLALEAAFWAQFPGAFARRVRPAAITTRNFAALAPFHTFPAGRPSGNHWGPAVALLRTSAGSPFHFSFHVGDLGHTFICGPSGSGKTVVQNFMLAQLEKLGAQQVFIDKDRGAELFVRASGGRYLTLRNGEPTGFAPFQALDVTPANQIFLSALVRRLAAPDGQSLSVSEVRAIDRAVAALAPLPRAQRSLQALRSLLGQRDAEGVGARIERWCRGGPLGWVLDNPADEVALDANLLGFDMTQLLDHAEIRAPAMMYLFHRLNALADGRRLVIDIDEFWKALADEAFRDLAQDGLKTFRKQNAVMVFGTQSPADVLRSPIAHTILEQCATKIFLPNPHAAEADYVDGFRLSHREFQLVREDLLPGRRQFLVKQGLNSVVVELRLDGLDDDLAILSGRAETTALLDHLRPQLGDDPAVWLPAFHHARKGLP